ncbi:MAG: hypothetical protein IPH54_12345 [Rhodoferax sp.]|nr:hypothetical protein [Rhodoferax sp.]
MGQARTVQQVDEIVHPVFVAVLRVDALPPSKGTACAGPTHHQVHTGLQMHLDARRLGVEKGPVLPLGHIKVAADQAVQVVERKRH